MPTAAKGKHSRCCKFMRMRRSSMSTNVKGSQGTQGKASCWKWVLKFALHPMEFWAGNRKNPNNSISSQQTGALFIGFIGLREKTLKAMQEQQSYKELQRVRTPWPQPYNENKLFRTCHIQWCTSDIARADNQRQMTNSLVWYLKEL